MNDPIAMAAAISQTIMLNAGLSVRVLSIVDLSIDEATLPVSMSNTAIKKIIFVHNAAQQMNISIELHVGMSADVPQLAEKILDQAQSKLLARYADAFPYFTGDLRTRATAIKLSTNDFAPFLTELALTYFHNIGFFLSF
jgi:hypothetical protein